MLHSIQSLVDSCGHLDSLGLLSKDLINAFNLVDRQRLCWTRCGSALQASSLGQLTATSTPPTSSARESFFLVSRAATKVTLSGPLFSLALKPVLVEEAKKIRDEFGVTAYKLFAYYLDDGCVIAEHEVLLRIVELPAPHRALLGESPVPDDDTDVVVPYFSHPIPRKLFNLALDKGLYLRLDKCFVRWKTRPSPEVQANYAALRVPVVDAEVTKVLGAPVGSETFCRDFVSYRVDEFRPLFSNVSLLEDAQVGISLLRACLGTRA